ncbi:protein kinase domain-containing protein [Allorhodopirellula solitaria]|uniref:Serine/threonine-protein kinase PknB n=1 Tax=Allorhodopirellula solitaria TaxID=2527987 RepID=A0A5C5XXY8_9BACT|nr:protein kinase [Allorhodopirellula solitaria]TWT66432.1 Serine/threonine-protein kinase PknB [Allorhodopirellula solitaria]
MMTAIPSQCPPSKKLHDYALGKLADEDSEAVFEHLSECSACTSELETRDDCEDSLIANLRKDAPHSRLDDEANCSDAVARAVRAFSATSHLLLDELPVHIGEYEIVRSLGSGGMGSVYLAEHTKLGRQVAIKVLATHRLADPRMQQRFESEMRAVGRLSHPNIVTAHDAREIEGTAVLVTEFIDGLDLRQLVAASGPMRIADACEILRHVALALAYTHDQGFVHRDIKPSNIMLSRTGEVKLLDLGLARFQYGAPDHPEITGTGQAMGTADYIAPEQIADSRTVDARADIYALGCTLMKLLTGSAPFADEHHPTPFAKMTAHVSNDPPRLCDRAANAPRELGKLLDSMLQKEPARRPQTPREVADRLAKFTDGHEVKTLLARAEGVAVAKDRPSQPPQRFDSPTMTKPSRQDVPATVAIAASFLGLLLGLILGVIISIQFPDGTTTQIDAPAGSRIAGEQQASRKPRPSWNGPSTPPQFDQALAPVQAIGNTGVPSGERLAMMILLDQDDLTPQELAEAKQMLTLPRGHKFSAVMTNHGIWIPLADEVEAPIVREHNGTRYALASSQPTTRIEWREMSGHITTQIVPSPEQADSYRLQLHFDPTLEKQVRQLTRTSLNEQLAIVVDDEITMAPRIQSAIRSSAALTGNFTLQEWQAIQRSILKSNGGQANSATPQANNALKEIGSGFHNFHSTYHKLPGSTNYREGSHGVNGNTMHPFSWRVAILPFIDHTKLFEEYRFDETWDSEHNSKLLEKMPSVYGSPANAADDAPGITHLLGFATEHGGLGTGDGQRFQDFTDGTSPTILVIEASKSVPWTKPEDLTNTNVTSIKGQPLRYLMADGTVDQMDPIDRDKLQKLITRDGGEFIAD